LRIQIDQIHILFIRLQTKGKTSVTMLWLPYTGRTLIDHVKTGPRGLPAREEKMGQFGLENFGLAEPLN
jgi:hypothetical protein